jgi:sugar O-acyltransferase (sialic acid O-acetyltransferase NeuD family)
MPAKFRTLCVIGAGGHGRVIADTAECLGYSDIQFVDSRWPEVKSNLHWPITANELPPPREGIEVFIAIGANSTRLSVLNTCESAGHSIATLIHPSAHVSKHATLAAGCFVAPLASVNVGSRLGKGCIVNTGATVDHDCHVDDGVHVSPGAHLAGGVKVGKRTWIGMGSSVRELTQIGEDAIIGAGAAIVATVENGATVLGVPGKARKTG